MYLSVWMYTVREMEDAIMDCTAGASLATIQLFPFPEDEVLRLILPAILTPSPTFSSLVRAFAKINESNQQLRCR